MIFSGLHHGGRIKAAARQYGIAESEWLDLSTGLNPHAWPIPVLPDYLWQRLPEDNDGLQQAACDYYGCKICLPLAGSQAAIQLLPRLRARSRVGVLAPSYAEHAHNWKQAGHAIHYLVADTIENTLPELDVLVVVNPNNPDGTRFEPAQLLQWQQQLSLRGGWLVVDEAFMDSTPEYSMMPYAGLPGLIVLRSLGKFFGLAGVRCGFVMAEAVLLQQLAERLGPWTLSTASREIARQALQDQEWQQQTRDCLLQQGERLKQLLDDHGLTAEGGTALFQWLRHGQAEKLFEHFARHGILLRYFPPTVHCESSLRFGLPGHELQWQRLQRVLSALPEHLTTTRDKEIHYG